MVVQTIDNDLVKENESLQKSNDSENNDENLYKSDNNKSNANKGKSENKKSSVNHNKQKPKNKKKSKVKITIISSIAVIVIIIAVLSVNTGNKDNQIPVAIVNGEIVTEKDIDVAYKTTPRLTRPFLTDDILLNQTIFNELLFQEATKLNLVASDKKVNDALSTTKENLRLQNMDFEAYLIENSLTIDDMEKFYKTHLSIENLLLATAYSQIKVTNAEILEFFNDNSEVFTNSSLEENTKEIKTFLIKQKEAEAFTEYINQLMESAEITIVSAQKTETAEDLDSKISDYAACANQNNLNKDTVLFIYAEKCDTCRGMMSIVDELVSEDYNFYYAPLTDNDVKKVLRDCFSDVLKNAVPQYICASNGEVTTGKKSKSELIAFSESC